MAQRGIFCEISFFTSRENKCNAGVTRSMVRPFFAKTLSARSKNDPQTIACWEPWELTQENSFEVGLFETGRGSNCEAPLPSNERSAGPAWRCHAKQSPRRP